MGLNLADKEEMETGRLDGNPLRMKNSIVYWDRIRLALSKMNQIEWE